MEFDGDGTMKPFMRIVLDEMPKDPDPIEQGAQGTFAGYDDVNDLMISWDDGRSLKLIGGIDRYHVVGMTGDEGLDKAEIEKSFEQLKVIQGKPEDGYSSRCPRCGQKFDCKRGAVSRRINKIMICVICGQQEAIEDFLIHGKEMGLEVNVSFPEGDNKTGFEAEEAVDGERKLKVTVKPLEDWYIVKIWQGRDISTLL